MCVIMRLSHSLKDKVIYQDPHRTFYHSSRHSIFATTESIMVLVKVAVISVVITATSVTIMATRPLNMTPPSFQPPPPPSAAPSPSTTSLLLLTSSSICRVLMAILRHSWASHLSAEIFLKSVPSVYPDECDLIPPQIVKELIFTPLSKAVEASMAQQGPVPVGMVSLTSHQLLLLVLSLRTHNQFTNNLMVLHNHYQNLSNISNHQLYQSIEFWFILLTVANPYKSNHHSSKIQVFRKSSYNLIHLNIYHLSNISIKIGVSRATRALAKAQGSCKQQPAPSQLGGLKLAAKICFFLNDTIVCVFIPCILHYITLYV